MQTSVNPGFRLKKNDLACISILCLLVILVYFNNLSNGFIDLDDYHEIVNNSRLSNLNLKSAIDIVIHPRIFGFYAPTKFLFYLFIKYVAGQSQSFYFHAVQDILHLLVVITAYILILLLSKNRLAAFISSALFAVHPCHSDTVNWVSGTGYALAALFSFGALILFIISRQKDDHNILSQKKNIFYWLSLILFILAFTTIPQAALTLAVLFFYEMEMARERGDSFLRKLRDGAKNILPFIAVAIFFLVVVLFIYRSRSTAVSITTMFGISSIYRIFGLLGHGLYYTIAPPLADLGTNVMLPSLRNIGFWLKIIFSLSCLGFFAFRFSKKERWTLILPVIFASYMIPNLLFLQADINLSFRYLYLPSLAVYAYIGSLLASAIQNRSFHRWIRYAAAVVLVFGLSALAFESRGRCANWASSESLWSSLTFGENAQQVIGYFRLGRIYADDRPVIALGLLQKSAEIANQLPKDGFEFFKPKNANKNPATEEW